MAVQNGKKNPTDWDMGQTHKDHFLLEGFLSPAEVLEDVSLSLEEHDAPLQYAR